MSRLHHHLTSLAAVLFALASTPIHGAGEPAVAGLKPGDIFLTTNIWTVHLTFTPEQWQARSAAMPCVTHSAIAFASLIVKPGASACLSDSSIRDSMG